VQKYLLLAVGAALVNNVVLVRILGLCPVMALSRKLEAALSLGLVTAFSLTLLTGLSYLVNEYVLAPLELEYLRTLVFILTLAACVGVSEVYLHRTQPLLAQTLRVFLPLSALNCATLGVALINLQEHHRFVESLFFGLGSAVGFVIVLVLFTTLCERLDGAEVPQAFRGNAIVMVTAGLMSLAFMGFNGLVK
jgi:Na+-translocating ferredoxin:NAD+ oxidoreductase subunit A